MTQLLPSPQKPRWKWFAVLLERKMPQVAVTYIGLSWGVVQFVDWLTNHYALSGNLTDFFAFLVVLLIPGVLLVAYCRGGSSETLTWAEKIGVPVNLAIAVIVLFLNFHGKELGSINQTVVYTDSSGKTVQREVPKSAFRKRIALFFFENVGTDRKLDWLAQGVPIALGMDLAQDLYLNVQDSYDYDLADQIRQAGFGWRDRLALGLMRQIAEDKHLDSLVTGTILRNGTKFTLQVDLYETHRVKLLASRVYSGSNLFALIDKASVQLKRDVGVPEPHIAEITDFPVAEVLTRSLPALEYISLAQNLSDFEGDFPGAERKLNRALAIDPSCATAYLRRYTSNIYDGQFEAAKYALNQANHYSYELIERDQLKMRIGRAWLGGNPQQKLAAIQQGVALYPEDIKTRMLLVDYYKDTARWEEAVTELHNLEELDSERAPYLLERGDIQARRGYYQEALAAYAEALATGYGGASALVKQADIYVLQGKFVQGSRLYQQAITQDGSNLGAQLGLVALDQYDGRFDAALSSYQSLLARSRTFSDRVDVYSNLLGYYRQRGQWQQFMEQFPNYLRERRRQGPINAILTETGNLDAYVYAGQPQVAFERLQVLTKQAGANNLLSSMVDFGRLRVYVALEKPDLAAPIADRVEQAWHRYSLDRLIGETNLNFLRGRIAEQRGNWSQALAAYRRSLVDNPNQIGNNTDIGRALRHLGDLSGARSAIQNTLSFDASAPDAHYELAEVALAEGDRTQAQSELRRALNILAKADPSDPWLRRVKALQQRELGSSQKTAIKMP
jgi:tetratricopeptide (TPR) repeat protein